MTDRVNNLFQTCASSIVRGMKSTSNIKPDKLVEQELDKLFAPNNTTHLLLYAFPPENFYTKSDVPDKLLSTIVEYFRESQEFLREIFRNFAAEFKELGKELCLNRAIAYSTNKNGAVSGPLATAIKTKNRRAIEFLKTMGIDLTAKHQDGNRYISPLIYAIRHSDSETIETLLELCNKSVKISISHCDEGSDRKTTPLIYLLSAPKINERYEKLLLLIRDLDIDLQKDDGVDYPITALLKAYCKGVKNPKTAFQYPNRDLVLDFVETMHMTYSDFLNWPMPGERATNVEDIIVKELDGAKINGERDRELFFKIIYGN